MAKRTRLSAEAHQHVDNDVMLRASAMAAVLLGGGLVLFYMFLPGLLGASKLAKSAQVGIELLYIWLVITSTIRSIHHIRAKIAGWKLLLAGCLIAVAGPIVRELLLRIIAQFSENITIEKYNFRGMVFFAGLGLLAASIATIRLRIKNRALGNMMELALVALVAFLFFYFMK